MDSGLRADFLLISVSEVGFVIFYPKEACILALREVSLFEVNENFAGMIAHSIVFGKWS